MPLRLDHDDHSLRDLPRRESTAAIAGRYTRDLVREIAAWRERSGRRNGDGAAPHYVPLRSLSYMTVVARPR